MSDLGIGTVCVHRQLNCLVQIMSHVQLMGEERRRVYDAVIWGPYGVGTPLVVTEMYLAPLDRTLGCWSAVVWDELGWRLGERITK